MADLKLKLPENVPGAFYVTCECIDCDQCSETAPTVFKRNPDIAFAVVFHQPATEAERQRAIEAQAGCPTDAIGNNG
jgi:ferredoxin